MLSGFIQFTVCVAVGQPKMRVPLLVPVTRNSPLPQVSGFAAPLMFTVRSAPNAAKPAPSPVGI